MAVAPSELGRRQPDVPLISILSKGDRIAMREPGVRSNGKPIEIFIHDPRGEIKVGNENVVVWKAPEKP